VAAIELERGFAPAPSADDVIAFCRDRLAFYKVPETIIFVPELPLTSMGKIRKLDLIEAFPRSRAPGVDLTPDPACVKIAARARAAIEALAPLEPETRGPTTTVR
jgi:AMP-binding enzyme C-terminal domain